MATPYFQQRHDTVTSTQNVAREEVGDLPLLVLARRQIQGRGRTGNDWRNADRALAASLAIRTEHSDRRPFSLIAGVAAARATQGTRLKWPNDVMVGNDKVGGILVEKSRDMTVVGLGMNLWWPEAPAGIAALSDEDPGEDRYAELGALWGAELMQFLDAEEWPIDEYRKMCMTLGVEIKWDPDGTGRALDVSNDGGLVVVRDGRTEVVYSGEIRHLRHRQDEV